MRVISVKGKRAVRLYATEKTALEKAAALSRELAAIGPDRMKDVATKAHTFTHALLELFKQEEKATYSDAEDQAAGVGVDA